MKGAYVSIILLLLALRLLFSYAYVLYNPLFSRKQSNGLTPQYSLVTDPDKACIIVNENRLVYPGDLVVHRELGVGKYEGIYYADLAPMQVGRKLEPVLMVKYKGAVITWQKKIGQKVLWLYRSMDSTSSSVEIAYNLSVTLPEITEYDLTSFTNPKKWLARYNHVKHESAGAALRSIQMANQHTTARRLPYLANNERFDQFEKAFRYTPTEDQIEAFKGVEEDMVYSLSPMNRLVCGDVGFGKTEVAMRAIYRAVMSGRQAALLAPTRVLAAQHARVLIERMPDVKIAYITGTLGASLSDDVLALILKGEYEVIVGTHTLLNFNSSCFKSLGLVVIDEEQRFGVKQKDMLKLNMPTLDVLTLTATPIPRTLQLSLRSLQALNIISTPPSGRKPVEIFVNTDNIATIKDAVVKELDRGGQVFVIVPFINLIQSTKNRIQKAVPYAKIKCIHGKTINIGEIMEEVSLKKVDVLISTTVIENGIDNPNVNTILVLYPEYYGMATLYQLRGRVGRSDKQAFAYYLVNGSSISLSSATIARLSHIKSLASLGSGYDIARKDLEIRGSGQMFGSDQSGTLGIGQDLETVVFRESLEEYTPRFIIPVRESRISIPSKLLTYGEMWLNKTLPVLENITDQSQLRQVFLWENNLVVHLIERAFRTANANNGLAKTFDEKGIQTIIAKAIDIFILCVSLNDAALLRDKLRLVFKNQTPALLIELLYRQVVRAMAQRLSIYDISEELNDETGDVFIVMKSAGINQIKWNSIRDKVNSTCTFECGRVRQDNVSQIKLAVGRNNTSSQSALVKILSVIEFLHPLVLAEDEIVGNAIAAWSEPAPEPETVEV